MPQGGSAIRSAIVAIELSLTAPDHSRLLPDWRLLDQLNNLTVTGGVRRMKSSATPTDTVQISSFAERAQKILTGKLSELDLPFKIPVIELWAVLWPAIGMD